MPKQFKTYTRFEGGLNTKTNARSIQENELAQANNVIVDEFGTIKSCGKAADNDTNYTDPNVTAMQPGYGLFQSTFDYASGGGNTSTVRTFLANADDGSANVVIHVLDATTWDTDDISLGAVTDTGNASTDQGRVIYHIADGNVRVCDTNITNVSTAIKKYGYVKAQDRWLNSSGTAQTPNSYAGVAAWTSSDTKLSKPTRGFVSEQIFGTETFTSGSDTSAVSSAVAGDPFVTAIDAEIDNHWAVKVGGSIVDLITNRNSATQLDTAAGGGNFGGGGHTYKIYPPSGTGFNLSIVPSSGGSWTAGTYEFGITFIYDGNQESLVKSLLNTISVSANEKITVNVLATESVTSGTRYDSRIAGARIYHRISGSDDAWTLFGDVSLRYGSRASLDGEYSYWTEESSNSSYIYSPFISYSENIDTYESINGFSPDSAFISIGLNGEKYQTSVVTNRRTFIGNVKYTNEEGELLNQGDTIRYSEINKFDTFPDLNFIDIGVNDGEEFVKLEAYADRLLAFKEKTLYIINIGGGSDTQWFLESEHKNMGVEFHAATVKTDFGVAWANKNGLFFYDGSQIKNLQTKILESQWSGFVDHLTMIAYEPTHKHLVVIRDADDESSDNGDAYIYSFITNSFTFVEDLVANSNKTNPITDAYNKLTMGTGTAEIVSYDGEPDSGTTFDLILKDDDFGMPNTVKKIYGVTVEYSSSAASSNGVKYIYTNSSGVKQDAYVNLGSLSDTGNSGEHDPPLMYVDKFNLSTPISVSSFQVKLDLGGSSVHKVNNVAVEYRPIYKRVT